MNNKNFKTLIVKNPLTLDCGRVIQDFPIAYETYGELNQKKDNAILIFHALTGDQFVTGKNPVTNKDGWWTYAVGPGKSIDTDKYFLICANVIGGCMHPPITFAQIKKYLSVSIDFPGPTAYVHHPSLFVTGFFPVTN